MAFTTLISTDALAKHVNESSFVIVDCRFKLDDVAWGEREYASAHIPGAVYGHLDRDLSGTKNGTNGRHPLPDGMTLASTLGRFGISDGMQVVAYDQDSGAYASRLWWMLRWMGHTAAAVLDGGIAKWKAEKRPTKSGVEQRPFRPFSGTPQRDMTIDVNGVEQLTTRSDWRLVDARAPERYRGEVESIDLQAGHIPTAVNHFFQSNLDERGLFRTPEDLRQRFTPTLGPVPSNQIVCYCGSGVTACHNLLAMEHAGLKGAKLYAGSWSEWSSAPHREIEKGSVLR
jgi:thiosulfate/3-mercaptopyruvate sulfurtransferase